MRASQVTCRSQMMKNPEITTLISSRIRFKIGVFAKGIDGRNNIWVYCQQKQDAEEQKEAKKKNDKDQTEALNNKTGRQTNEGDKKREQSSRQQQQQQQAEEEDSDDNRAILSDNDEEERAKDKEGPKKKPAASGGSRRGKPGNSSRSGNNRGGVRPGQKRKQNNQKDNNTKDNQEDTEMDLNDTHEVDNDDNNDNENDHIEEEEEEKAQTSKTLAAMKKQQSPNKFFLYREGVKLPDLTELINQSIEVRASKEYITRFNREIQSRSVWGSDNYTSDSDLICMLIHHGLIRFDMPQLKSDSNYAGIKAMLKVNKTRKTYTSVEKNGIISRPNKSYAGLTIKPESIGFIQTLGTTDELLRNAALMSQPRKKLKRNNWVNPRNIVGIPEASIIFDLSNEPAYKYSIVNFCDKSEDSKDWMSQRLKKEVLYLETDNDRYEISKVSEADMIIVNEYDAYKIVKVNEPYWLDNLAMSKLTLPLSAQYATLIFKDIDWSEFLWGSHCLKLRDLVINNLKAYKFFPRNKD